MRLDVYRHLWGVTLPLAEALARIAAEGYAGVEADLPEPADEAEFRAALDASGLRYIPIVLAHAEEPAGQEAILRRELGRAARFDPPFITCHAGRDRWPFAVTLSFLERLLALEAELGVPVAHETHRSRALYDPWRTRDLLRELPDLRLCCDYSHWVVVAERLLDDEPDVLGLAAAHCLHVHARVGYEQGPQVPDPSAPEYRYALEAHERWWEQIWRAQERRGMAVSTLTPEYGPPGYLHTLPHTGAPVADLWTVARWQADRERQRFAACARS